MSIHETTPPDRDTDPDLMSDDQQTSAAHEGNGNGNVLPERIGTVERQVRYMRADLALCLNYVRELAKGHLPAERVQELEEERRASIDDVNDAQ